MRLDSAYVRTPRNLLQLGETLHLLRVYSRWVAHYLETANRLLNLRCFIDVERLSGGEVAAGARRLVRQLLSHSLVEAEVVS